MIKIILICLILTIIHSCKSRLPTSDIKEYEPDNVSNSLLNEIGDDRCLSLENLSGQLTSKQALDFAFCGDSTHLEEYVAKDSIIGQYMTLVYARYLYSTENFESLGKLLLDIKLDGDAKNEAAYYRARYYIWNEQWTLAQKELEDFLNKSSSNLSWDRLSRLGKSARLKNYEEDPYYWLGIVHSKLENNDLAKTLFQFVWAAFPDSEYIPEVKENLDKLEHPVYELQDVPQNWKYNNSQNLNMNLKQVQTYWTMNITRALAFVYQYEREKANKILMALADRLAPDDKIWILKIARTFFKFNKFDIGSTLLKEKGIDPFSSAAKSFFSKKISTSPREYETFLYGHAYGLYRQGAKDASDLFAKKFPKGRLADKLSFKKAFSTYDKATSSKTIDKKKLRKAVKEFKIHLRQFPKTYYNQSSRWFWAYSSMLLKDEAQAKTAFSQIIALKKLDHFEAGARYWIAKMNSSEDKKIEQFTQIQKDYPNSIYAWLISLEIGFNFALAKAKTPPNMPNRFTDKYSQRLKAARILSQTGFLDLAEDALMPLTNQFTKKKGQWFKNKSLKIKYVHHLHKYNIFHVGSSMFRKTCNSKFKELDSDILTACFPKAFEPIVKKNFKSVDLLPSPYIMYSMMRQESNFDPLAKSWVGARGVLQLMPATAQKAHKDELPANISFDVKNLNFPIYNIFLSIKHLDGMVDKFLQKGATINNKPVGLPHLMASYNAGAHRLPRWLIKHNSDKFDYFIENIGFNETRGYVKAVLGNYMAYLYLYGTDQSKVASAN